MTAKSAKERIAKLQASINNHRYLYHVLNKQEISEAALDALKHELVQLESAFPQFITPDSPSQRVAGEPLAKFEKVTHRVPQWSFNDVFNEEELHEFNDRLVRLLDGQKPTYVCELKIDGFKIVLTYERGLLVTAATRGNGAVGENVTMNVRTIESIPLRLEEPVDIIVEGEIWMSGAEFHKLNATQKKAGKELYANPRNVAAGTIRQLDPRLVATRNLDAFAYDIAQMEPQPETQMAELALLGKLGFKVNPHFQHCKTIDDVIRYWQVWEGKRGQEPYGIDGVVVKVNERKYQDQLGYTGKAPRFGVAFKFPADQTTTIVEDVQVQVGRTGVLTPVAHLRPVQVAGTTVARATLHNFDEIKRLGLKIGDTVVLEKAGDVIPRVVKALDELRTGKESSVPVPKKCPICGSPVAQEGGLVALRCLNKDCYAQERRKLYYFVSKNAFDIEGVGPRVIDLLIDRGLVATPADIFDLQQDDLAVLPGLGEKSAHNLISAIRERRQIELPRFLIALGIPQVGEETAHDLAKHFRSFKRIRAASLEELAGVYGVGEVVARSLHEFFKDRQQQKIVQALLKRVKVLPIEETLPNLNKAIGGKTFVLTGTLDKLTREEAKQKIRAGGGNVSSSISKETDFLVAGVEPGEKYERAQKLGVKILGEQEFLKLLGL